MKSVSLKRKTTQPVSRHSPEPSPSHTERYNLLYRAEQNVSRIKDKVAYDKTWVQALPEAALIYVRQAILALDAAAHNLFWTREALSETGDGDDRKHA